MIEFRFRVPNEMAPVAWHHVSDLAGVSGLCAAAVDEDDPLGDGSGRTAILDGNSSSEEAV